MSEQEEPRESRTPVHLVLSAGGIKCVSYIGAIRVLEKNGIEFKTVSTCSAGSLIGALLCGAAEGLQDDSSAFQVPTSVVSERK